MSTAALFNSISQPILTGDWFERRFDASFDSLVRGMRKIAFARACAVGSQDIFELFKGFAPVYRPRNILSGVAPERYVGKAPEDG